MLEKSYSRRFLRGGSADRYLGQGPHRYNNATMFDGFQREKETPASRTICSSFRRGRKSRPLPTTWAVVGHAQTFVTPSWIPLEGPPCTYRPHNIVWCIRRGYMEALNLAPMLPRGARLSVGCTFDWCRNSAPEILLVTRPTWRSQNCISDSFRIARKIIYGRVDNLFFWSWTKTEFCLIPNQKEICQHDLNPLDLKGRQAGSILPRNVVQLPW